MRARTPAITTNTTARMHIFLRAFLWYRDADTSCSFPASTYKIQQNAQHSSSSYWFCTGGPSFADWPSRIAILGVSCVLRVSSWDLACSEMRSRKSCRWFSKAFCMGSFWSDICLHFPLACLAISSIFKFRFAPGPLTFKAFATSMVCFVEGLWQTSCLARLAILSNAICSLASWSLVSFGAYIDGKFGLLLSCGFRAFSWKIILYF